MPDSEKHAAKLVLTAEGAGAYPQVLLTGLEAKLLPLQL